MISYENLSKYERKFLAMTGYRVIEFASLLEQFRAEFEAYVTEYCLDGTKRQKRKYVEYKNSPLPTIADKLLFILVYLKQGSLQEEHATLFKMHQPDANRWIHLLHQLLNQALAKLGELPARTMADLAKHFAQEKDLAQLNLFLHDGTERAIVRPKDTELQKLYYSGKKKVHTLKNLLLINALCKIIFLSATEEGKKHDKKVADEAQYTLPQDSLLYQDTGFQGFSVTGVVIVQPKKKPRGKELTNEDKENNQQISQVRIRIEHAIGGVKRYRIVKDKLRNWRKGFRDQVMETCCGLHNFRLNFRPWHYDPL